MSPPDNLELCTASSGSWLISNLSAAIGSPRLQQDGSAGKGPLRKPNLVHCRTRRWAVDDPPGPRARVPPALLVPHAARVQCCETAETPCRFGVLGPAADHSTATARQPNGRIDPIQPMSFQHQHQNYQAFIRPGATNRNTCFSLLFTLSFFSSSFSFLLSSLNYPLRRLVCLGVKTATKRSISYKATTTIDCP